MPACFCCTNVLYKEFDKLNQVALKNRDGGKYKFIGEYAATNETEFFAVLTERFYESPQSLKKQFYHVDPVEEKRV